MNFFIRNQWAQIEAGIKDIHGGEDDLLSVLGGVQDANVTVEIQKDIHSMLGDVRTETAIDVPIKIEDTDNDDNAMTVAELSFEDTGSTITLRHSSEHNYFAKEHKVQYKCDDCGYITNRKNTLTNHQAETCHVRRQKGLLSVKTSKCKFCLKMMRHNALRAHLRHVINALKANKSPKGHSSSSLKEYIDYLEEIKLT